MEWLVKLSLKRSWVGLASKDTCADCNQVDFHIVDIHLPDTVTQEELLLR